MSIKPSCSYTLTVNGGSVEEKGSLDTMEAIESLMREQGLIPYHFEGGFAEFSGFWVGTYSTPEDAGSEDQWDVESALLEVSRQFPQVTFTASEQNEEPFSPDFKVSIEGGERKNILYGRRLEPTNECDHRTVAACIRWLRDAGMKDAVKLLQSKVPALSTEGGDLG